MFQQSKYICWRVFIRVRRVIIVRAFFEVKNKLCGHFSILQYISEQFQPGVSHIDKWNAHKQSTIIGKITLTMLTL